LEIKGKTVLVTGGTSGLGFEAAVRLLSEGAVVYAMGRNLKEGWQPVTGYRFIKTDFSDLGDIQRVLKRLSDEKIKFDMVFNNAGVLTSPEFSQTVDGFEYSFQVNFLSHLFIDWSLLASGSHGDNPCFISITSPVYKYFSPRYTFPAQENFKAFRTYAETKYYLLLLGDFLCKEFPGKVINFIGFSPGTFNSGIYRMQRAWFRKMYRVGELILRDPGIVADRLLKVIKTGEPEFNNVYSVSGRTRHFLPDPVKASFFIGSCLGAVQSRFRDAR